VIEDEERRQAEAGEAEQAMQAQIAEVQQVRGRVVGLLSLREAGLLGIEVKM